jgi:hypothetical protein
MNNLKRRKMNFFGRSWTPINGLELRYWLPPRDSYRLINKGLAFFVFKKHTF